MHVVPVKPTLIAPGTKRLKLKYDEPLSNFAFKFNFRRYTVVCASALHSYAYEHSIFPQMSACSLTGFTLTVNVNEAPSKVYYMVVEYTDNADVKLATDPTNEQVVSQASYTPVGGSTAITPLAYGYIDAPSVGVTYSQAVTFTNTENYYQVFVTTMGPSGNLGDGRGLHSSAFQLNLSRS